MDVNIMRDSLEYNNGINLNVFLSCRSHGKLQTRREKSAVSKAKTCRRVRADVKAQVPKLRWS